MGFYGNITNTSNTTFSFDRIYPNRLSMDANANNDGVFIGRYVLVEYEQSAAYPNIYINNGKYYSSPNFEEATRIKYKSGGRPASDTSNDVFYLGEFGQKQESEKIYFYMCDGYETIEENLYATFKQVTAVNKDDATPYLINHNIDYEEYKNAKGYDSSVWTKVNEEQNGKLITRYRNIADLNSVVPTFDLETDAPTMTPITPHFDADSTNVYYKLHTQPQWGLRVAAQEDENSDSTTTWQFTTYNPATDETITHEEKNKAAAINFNGPAFDAQVGKANILKYDSGENYITILPTGESGKKYYTHTNKNGEKVYEKAPDIQEVRINLPAIGNMMSDAWDIIHGPLRNDDMREFDTDGKNVSSLKGRLDSIDALEDDTIPVKRDADGKLVGNKLNGGKTSTTDYTGKDDDEWIETLVNGNEETITIHHTYDLENKLNYKDIGHLEGKLNSNNDTTNNIDLNDGTNEFKINTPIVDSMGHVVGRNTETIELPYGYKYFKTEGLSDVTIDLYSKNVDKIGGHSENKTTNSIDNDTQAHNTQDTLSINPANKWIQTKLEDTSTDGDILTIAHEIHSIDERNSYLGDNETSHSNPNKEEGANNEINLTMYDWTYDEAGHITSKRKHTYTLPFSYKNIEIANDGSASSAEPASMTGTQTADATQDELKLTTSNKWILLDAGEEDTVKFGHLLKTIAEDKKPTQNLSNEESKTITFEVYDDSFDEAGHHNGRDTKTLTMPFGYGKIKGDNGNTAATATFDELTISANDNWIATTVSKDTVNITHTGPVLTSARNESNKTPNFGDTFTIEDWVFDDKGHKSNLSTHSIKIPKGSLNDLTATSSSVLTGISMIDETGVITQTNNNVGKLALTGYVQGSDKTDIGSGDTINSAFAKLQNQITYEENRINTILTGENDLTGTLDTFIELQSYINEHGQEAADMAKAIENEIARAKEAEEANQQAISDETIRADLAEKALGTRIDNLDYEKTRVNNYYISSIKQTDGLIEVGTTLLPIRTVTSGTTNGTILVNGSAINVGGLKSAAYTESAAYATASQGATADRIATTIDATDIVAYKAEDFVLKSEYNALLSDFNDLKALVEQLNNQINPPQQPDNSGNEA